MSSPATMKVSTMPDKSSPMHVESIFDVASSTEAGFESVEQSPLEEQDEGEMAPPLLQPDPSRLLSCLRAPCLKRQAPTQSVSSGASSPRSGAHSPNNVASFSFSGIKTLCLALPKRQVHFDAEPPEAGLTHSGDQYDRRPIECTQGGSLHDLSLPPRGTCPSYGDDADDEACDDGQEEDEESKQVRLRGFAKWARLKNGSGMLAGVASSLKSTSPSAIAKKGSEESVAISNACSTPVHGIRAFGRLAGQSGLTKAEEQVANNDEKAASRHDKSSEEIEEETKEDTTIGSFDDDVSEATADAICGNDDSESEERNEAFRQAVYAALSKDPNATPMPSPSVRPRWECVTSYFDSSVNEEERAAEGKEISSLDLASEEREKEEKKKGVGIEDDSKESLASGAPLSKEQEASKVATWTQDQAAHGEGSSSASSVLEKAGFGLTLPRPKGSPSASLEESSLTNVSSSPMSSRCSSSEAWGSESGGGHWSGSEHDAFEAACSQNANVMLKPLQPRGLATSSGPRLESAEPGLSAQDEATPTQQTQMVLPQHVGDAEHHDVEHTSSSSSGGGAGWLSSCCTSPDLSPLDAAAHTVVGGPSQPTSLGGASLKLALMQQLAPLELGVSEGMNAAKGVESESPSRASPRLLALPPSGVASPLSGQCSPGYSSPRVYSGDEEDCQRRSLSPFRCPGKKSRKTRRTASGSDVRGGDDSEVGSSVCQMSSSRSKSMSHAPGMKRTSSLKKSTAFQADFDDEGALGGF